MLENLRLGLMAGLLAMAFTVYAMYLAVKRNPARMELPGAEAVLDWRRTYRQDFWRLGALATGGGLMALGRWHYYTNVLWPLGGFLLLAYWPFTMLAMGPTRRLLLTRGMETTARALPLLTQWNTLHKWVVAMGILATTFCLGGAFGFHYGRY